MKGRSKVVMFAFRIAEDRPDQEGQHRRLDQGGEHVGAIAQFADEGALEQDNELADFITPAQAFPTRWSLRQGASRLGS